MGRWTWCSVGFVLCGCALTHGRHDRGRADDNARTTTDAGLSDARSPGARSAAASSVCTAPTQYELTVFGPDGSRLVSSDSTDPSIPTEWDFEGTATEQSRGLPSDTPAAWAGKQQSREQLSYLRIREDATGATLTLVLRGVPNFGVHVGARVRVQLGATPDSHGQTLTLLVGDQLALYYLRTDASEEPIAPEPWQVRAGAQLCMTQDACGEILRRKLEVEGPDGENANVAEDQPVATANYAVFGARLEYANSSPNCRSTTGLTELVLLSRTLLGTDGVHCQPRSRSTLPGVEIRFSDDAVCTFTREQARAGGQLVYEIVVGQEIPGISSFVLGSTECALAPGELKIYEALVNKADGTDNFIACSGTGTVLVGVARLFRGVSTRRIDWYDKTWMTLGLGTPTRGDALVAGTYTFVVRAQGLYGVEASNASDPIPFELESSVDIRLTD